MESKLFELSRGDLGRAIYKNNDWNFSSISKPIEDLMSKVSGAELVTAQRGRIGDEYHATYMILPEAVTVQIDASIHVRIKGIGADSDSIKQAYQKMKSVLTL